MGTVKPVEQLYGSPTALTSQYLAWDRYCTYVVQAPIQDCGETNIPGTNKTNGSTRTTRSLLPNSHFVVYRNQTSERMKNRNQQSFLQVSLSSIIVQKQKNRTLAHWN